MNNVIMPNENFANMVIEQRPPHGVYVKTDESDQIIAINSSAFLQDTDGWVKIDEGYGDRYHHAQGNYFLMPIMDEQGAYRFKLENGKVLERTKEEMGEDYTSPVVSENNQINLIEEIVMLKESNRQLQEALDLLLSGATEVFE